MLALISVHLFYDTIWNHLFYDMAMAKWLEYAGAPEDRYIVRVIDAGEETVVDDEGADDIVASVEIYEDSYVMSTHTCSKKLICYASDGNIA